MIMEKLKDRVELKNIGYPMKATLVKRAKRKAMYLRDDGYYEVFKIKIKKEGKVFDRCYPDREVYPYNEDFGFTAWCCTLKENAERWYRNL